MSTPKVANISLGRQAREVYLKRMAQGLISLADQVQQKLAVLMDASTNVRDSQDRRDAWMTFQKAQRAWVEGSVQTWRRALLPPVATVRIQVDPEKLELMGHDAVDTKILASRLALAITDKISWEVADLRVRLLSVDGTEELASHDVIRPDCLALPVVEQWMAAGLSTPAWTSVQDLVSSVLTGAALEGCQLTNKFLIANGVMPEIVQRANVKRAPDKPSVAKPQSANGGIGGNGAGQGGTGESGSGQIAPASGSGYGGIGGSPGGSYAAGEGGNTGFGQGGGSGTYGASSGSGGGQYGAGSLNPRGGAAGMGGGGMAGAAAGNGSSGVGSGGNGSGGSGSGGSGSGGNGSGGNGSGGAGSAGGGSYGSANADNSVSANDGSGSGPSSAGNGGGTPRQPGGYSPGGYGGGASEETRMLTAATPLARVRMRAQGVMGNLRRLLTNQVDEYEMSRTHLPSPQLMQAIGGWIAAQPVVSPLASVDIDLGAVQQAAVAARETTKDLKKKASTDSEKATIEIVALMFQSILAEDRLPPGVRVWFARLQMPVLRVALGEPEFFESLQHPARKLIDRMGSCVMGFEGAAVSGGAMEVEVRRIVQTIEQYPETGRRVFELVYTEFEKFLAKYLTEKGSTRRLASVAQQVEQKEAMAIQYTIELRNMLKDLPVNDLIREFLLKTWSDVMAVVAMQHGAQGAETLSMKQTAADLVWAAGAKPNRTERAKVIADLPLLLQRMRKGMTGLGLSSSVQDAQLKAIGDVLAQAFLSKTETVDHEKIEKLGMRLANLEEYFDEDAVGDLPLDNENVELMLGIDTANIVVIADGGTRATEGMTQWAKALELGAWFTLEHNHHTARVQFAWRSEKGNLNLFASPDGRNFLVQAGRLAAYLQAGLLLPMEEETLTVRATRDALSKLDANPERLLSH